MEVLRLKPFHQEQLRAIAEGSFESRWEVRDFTFFLHHLNGYGLGLSIDRVILSYVLGLLVHGELDVVSVATCLDERRKGYAARVWEAVLKDPDVTQVSLEVRADNVAALGLYQKLGLRVNTIRLYSELFPIKQGYCSTFLEDFLGVLVVFAFVVLGPPASPCEALRTGFGEAISAVFAANSSLPASIVRDKDDFSRAALLE